MSNKFKRTGRKALSVFLSTTTAVWLSGAALFVPAAQAATLAELQAMLASIQQQIAALGGGSSSATQCTFTRSLTVGSTGSDVQCLQQYLNSSGHQVSASGAGSPGNETTYFGSRTKAAVAAWQVAMGVSPAAGYFGPISQAKYATVAGGATPPPPPGTPPPPAGVGTGLTVSAGTQPAASLSVQNAINVPYTRVRFTASADGDVTVNSVTVERTGLMNDAALTGIILLDENGNRIGLSKTLNSNHQAILTDSFVVKAGQTRELTLAGDMNSSLSSYAGQVGFLTLVAVHTSATVNGSLPISGVGQVVNASLTVGSITLTRGANDPGASNSKEVGTTGYIFTAIKATAGSAEDMIWRSIRFNQSGSAGTGDLGNVVVIDVKTGTSYPTVVSTDGKYYTATFGSGLTMKKGESQEVYLKGDIISGSNRGVDFDIYRYSDVVFKGTTFGYDVQPTATNSGDSSTDDDGTFQNTNPVWDAYEATIGGGSLRVEAANDKVPAQNIVAGGTKLPIGGFRFEARGEPITFTSWVITVTTTSATAASKNEPTSLTVYDENGAAVAGPKDVTTTTVTLTDSVTVPVGIHTYTVKANIDTNWTSNDTIVVSFTPSTAITSVTGQSTGNSITPTPAVGVTGSTMTVKAGSLTVTPSTSLAAQNVIAPATGIELGRFTLDAGASGDDLRVTTATVRMTSTAAAASFSGLKLMNGTTQLNTGSNVLNVTGNSQQTLTFTLDNNLIIPKQSSQVLNLIGNIASTATSGGTVRFDFSAGTMDWAVTTKTDGSSVSESLATANGSVMTIKTAGGYSVAVDPSAPVEKWYAAGSTGVLLNVLRFTGTTEDLAVTDLRLQLDTHGSSSGADFAAIELRNADDTLIQRKSPVAFTNGIEDFQFAQTGTGSFIIPKDGYKAMKITADLATVGTNQAGIAGQLVGVGFDGAGTAAAAGKQKATGKQSGTSVHSSTTSDQPSATDTTTQIVYFRSVPTVERLPLVATTLSGGEKTLYRFKVTADPKYDVALNRVTFKIATTGGAQFAANSNFRLINVTDNKIVGASTGTAAAFFTTAGSGEKNYDSTGQLVVRMIADTTQDYTVAYVTIPAGAVREFEFRGVPITDGTGDSVSTFMMGNSARPAKVSLTGATTQHRQMGKITFVDTEQRGPYGNSTAATEAASSTTFIWSDFSSDATTTHAVTTADWMNGFKIPGLPTTGLAASSLTN